MANVWATGNRTVGALGVVLGWASELAATHSKADLRRLGTLKTQAFLGLAILWIVTDALASVTAYAHGADGGGRPLGSGPL